MVGELLDVPARTAFASAIAAIESASAAEVVVCVRRRSAGYRHVNVIIGAVIAFAGLAVMLFGEHEFALTAIWIDPFVIGGIAGALVELLPDVKRWLTPPARREQAVQRAARATFVERGVHGTRDRSGLLVYISRLEHRVVLVADRGVASALGDEAIAAAEHALSLAISEGGAAVAHALTQLAPALAKAMPHRADDINELPDEVDSDLERTTRRPRSQRHPRGQQ